MPISLASYSIPSPSLAAQLSSTDLGSWNTSTRVLASLLSDGLVSATPSQDGTSLLIHKKQATPSSPAVWIGLSRAGQQRLASGTHVHGTPLPAVFPGDFAAPVATTAYSDNEDHVKNQAEVSYSPAVLLAHLKPVIDNPTPIQEDCFNTICTELANSASNGAHWIDWYRSQKPLELKSSMLKWEQALYTGHPTHPVSGLNSPLVIFLLILPPHSLSVDASILFCS